MIKKLRLILLIPFCIQIISCVWDKKKSEIKSDNIIIDNSSTNMKLRYSPDSLFVVFYDSVKNFQLGMPLPNFFYNHLLDYQNPWLTDHNTLSLRQMLFDSTQNTELLRVIIASDDGRLRMIVDSEMVSNKELLRAIPYVSKSNYEMAISRLKSIEGRK